MRRMIRPLLAGLVTMLAITALGGGAQVSPASALAAGATVNVVIDEFTPVNPKSEGTLRIAGRLANATPTVVTDVRVRLRVSASPLTSRDDISVIASAPLQLTPSTIPSGLDADGYSLEWTTKAVTPELRAGSEATFDLEVPMARLPLGRPGAYVVTVEAIGRGPGDEFDERQGIQRTFLPWFPKSEKRPLQVTWLWPLSDAPARTATGTFLNDDIPTALAKSGRLGRLVELGASGAVSWIVDPSLLQSAAAIGDGYQVERDGTLVVGDDGANGPAWLAALKSAVTSTSPLHTLPYANVDAAAVRRAGLATDVTQAITLGPRVTAESLDAPQGEALAWMPMDGKQAGSIDRQTSNLLVKSGVRTVILSTSSMQDDGINDGIGSLGTIAGPLTAILADDDLSRLAASATPTNSQALEVRQQFLAHLAVSASSPNPPTSVVVAPAMRWDPSPRLIAPLLRATRTASWLTPITVDQLIKEPRSPRQRLQYSTAAKQAELGTQYLTGVRREQTRLAGLAAVLDDPTDVVEPFGQALLRAESSAWRAAPQVGSALLTSIRRDLISRTNGVHVLSRGSIVFSGDVGAVPVTIENDLESAVTVGVRLIGEPAARLSSTPLESIHIEAGKRVSVNLDARVIGGDPLRARVQLLTPSGERYGTPGIVTLSSTAYARAASWVVIAAFIAIAIFVVFGITRRLQKARAGRPASRTDDEGSGTLTT